MLQPTGLGWVTVAVPHIFDQHLFALATSISPWWRLMAPVSLGGLLRLDA